MFICWSMSFYIHLSQEIDIERRRERIECVITNFPAVNNTIEIADEVSVILQLLGSPVLDFFVTSGKIKIIVFLV